jgi:hypothetical protein
MSSRSLSLPKSVAAAGGIEKWNQQPTLKQLNAMMDAMCTATTVEDAVAQVNAIFGLGHYLWAYMYMRKLGMRSIDLLYGTILAEPSVLLPVMYTPTVGEACQVRAPHTLPSSLVDTIQRCGAPLSRSFAPCILSEIRPDAAAATRHVHLHPGASSTSLEQQPRSRATAHQPQPTAHRTVGLLLGCTSPVRRRRCCRTAATSRPW